MSSNRIVLFAVIVLALASLACNAFAGNLEPGAVPPPPPIAVEVTAVSPTTSTDISPTDAFDPAATATLAGTAVTTSPPSTDGTPSVIALVDINIRTGPGVVYERDGFLFKGESAQVLGQEPTSGWWKIVCPSRATGSECWVSGGSQYTQPNNTAGVPVAIAPPTPTPLATATAVAGSISIDSTNNLAASSEALLAYRDGDAIWTMTLDLSQSPPTAGIPQQIIISPNIRNIYISPDGTQIAYLVGSLDANELRLVNRDGTGGRTLVRSTELPIATTDPSFAALIGSVQWLPDSQGLAFNTRIINLVGPGLGEQQDLWVVDTGGTVDQRFPAGSGGGQFDISPTGRLILAGDETVSRANLDGSNQQTVINFDFVNTASEYAFFPVPQWTADGSAAYLAISGEDPFGGDETALWRVPVDGPAQPLAALDSLVLFDPVIWSPDGSRLAHVARQTDGSPPQLLIGDGDGRNLTPVDMDTRLAFLAWSPNSSSYLYTGEGFVSIGTVDTTPVIVPLPAGEQALTAAWLTNTSYLYISGSGNAWTVHSGLVSGLVETLVGINSSLFDVYLP